MGDRIKADVYCSRCACPVTFDQFMSCPRGRCTVSARSFVEPAPLSGHAGLYGPANPAAFEMRDEPPHDPNKPIEREIEAEPPTATKMIERRERHLLEFQHELRALLETHMAKVRETFGDELLRMAKEFAPTRRK